MIVALAATIVTLLLVSGGILLVAVESYREARRPHQEREPTPWDNLLPGARPGAADDPGCVTRLYSQNKFVQFKRVDSHL